MLFKFVSEIGHWSAVESKLRNQFFSSSGSIGLVNNKINYAMELINKAIEKQEKTLKSSYVLSEKATGALEQSIMAINKK